MSKNAIAPGIGTASILEIVAKYVGRTSSAYRYIAEDLKQIDASHKGGSEHFQDRLAEIEGRPRPEPEVDEVEEVAACLGDDAAAMLDENPEDERALNMQRAAELLTELQPTSHDAGVSDAT